MNHSSYRLAVALTLCALATGCATSSPEQRAEQYKERCAARGYQPNSDALADCIARFESEREVRMDARRREMTETPPPPPIQQR